MNSYCLANKKSTLGMIEGKILMRYALLALLLFVCTSNIKAQNVLSLEESISLALRQSYSIQEAEYSLTSSRKNLEAAKLGLMSSVRFEFDVPRYSLQLSSQFNPSTGSEEFFKTGNTTVEGRLLISQPLLFSNGTISLIGSLFGRDQYSDFAGTNRDYFSNLSIRLNQPLFVFNSQKASLEKAEINLDRAERNYSKAERGIIYNVTASFLRLYQSKKRMEITRERVKQNEESFETASNKFKAGLIAEVEAMQLEVDLASSRNELLDAERNFEKLKNEFKLLIGIDLGENIDVTAELKFNPIDVNLEEAINTAIANQPDLQNAKDEIRLSEISVEEVDAQSTFRADLSANYGINKNDDRFKDVFSNFLDNRSVVMTLSIPVWDWGKNRTEVQAAEAGYKSSKLNFRNLKESIRNEIISSVNRINTAISRVDVLSKSVEVAEKSYNISLERFKSGTITSFDLSQIQLRLVEAKQSSLNALIDYELAIAELERKTMRDYH